MICQSNFHRGQSPVLSRVEKSGTSITLNEMSDSCCSKAFHENTTNVSVTCKMVKIKMYRPNILVWSIDGRFFIFSINKHRFIDLIVGFYVSLFGISLHKFLAPYIYVSYFMFYIFVHSSSWLSFFPLNVLSVSESFPSFRDEGVFQNGRNETKVNYNVCVRKYVEYRWTWNMWWKNITTILYWWN